MTLAWKDHFVQRQKIVVAVFTAWLTITAALYVFLSSNAAPPITTIRGTDDITHVRPKQQTNPLHRTAHEKFEAWAKAHPSKEQMSRSRNKQTVMERPTTPKVKTAENPSPNALPVPHLTAKEKLAAYAKASLQRKPGAESAPQQQPVGTMMRTTTRLRKTAHDKLQAYVKTTLERPGEEPAKTQRQKFEAQFPPSNGHRTRSLVASHRNRNLDNGIRATSSLLNFDPFDCPDTPPHNYPLHYSLVDMLKEWPVDQLQWPAPAASTTTMENETASDHPYLYQSLCIFDWDRPEHWERMRRYQIEFDVPFVLRNQPEFLQAVERWMHPDYLQELIGSEPQRNEHSFQTNHLPFWRTQGLRTIPSDWRAPTENVLMTYAEWSQRADAMDQVIAEGQQDQTKLDHYYFRLNANTGKRPQNSYLYDELPVFNPTLYKEGENLFMRHPDQERGINCRLGMAGNVAEAHYDYSSNWIALLGGHRRYILTHPRECQNLALYPPGHPSARHSSVNWSEITASAEPNSTAAQALSSAAAAQVILQASDALYLPTNWLHFIVSLDRNYQCNARSGIRKEYNSYIEGCGFTLA